MIINRLFYVSAAAHVLVSRILPPGVTNQRAGHCHMLFFFRFKASVSHKNFHIFISTKSYV